MSVNFSIKNELSKRHNLQDPLEVYYNLPVPTLYEEAIRRGEGRIGEGGTFVGYTSPHTGRSPKDRFVVREPSTENDIDWGAVNKPVSPEVFDYYYRKVMEYFKGRDVFVKDLQVCSHPDYRTNVRVINEFAWHNIFANNLFLRSDSSECPHREVGFTVISAPGFKANDFKKHDLNSETFILLNLSRRIALIGGTRYAGEMKKSVFAAMNFLLPEKNVFPMHCSANVGRDGDVALFFGLSGTGKTTLSADPERSLIGDDEHGWFDGGVFNFEGGCYAKMIKLNPKTEPEIYNAALKFGSVLENVELDSKTAKVNFDSDKYTENTRGAYQIDMLDNIVADGMGGVPRNIFMLTYDAFGVLPPISKLDSDQAMYYFLLGYTAKVAGTERGVSKPQATFSSCFGSPFLPRSPKFYGQMLKHRMESSNNVKVWLLNTGISGGPFGVGKRMPLPSTRALVTAAVTGELYKREFIKVPILNLSVPVDCPGVNSGLLQPRLSWNDTEEYDRKAKQLSELFEEEYRKYL